MAKTISALAFLALAAAAVSEATLQYDYVIVGGGTSGLVLANRLSEHSGVSVAVIEAGGSVRDNPIVADTNGFLTVLGTEVDWNYTTLPQKYTGNKIQPLHGGKALGGTSTINGMTYTRVEDAQIDAWEKVGNAGWTWDALFPYYKKSEQFVPPNAEQAAGGAAYNPDYHGFAGHLTVGWPNDINNWAYLSAFNSTLETLNVPYNKDVNGGKMRGLNVFPETVNPVENVREDAARAYYYGIENRTNLDVFLFTFADRIVWGDSAAGAPLAKGVEVTASNGTSYTIYARKEVILSAGSYRTPMLLEYSGVGDPRILNSYGIPVKVDLPSVGTNLQDQTNVGISTNLSDPSNSTTTLTEYIIYASASDILGDSFDSVKASVNSSIPEYAAKVASDLGLTNSTINFEKLFRVQFDVIFEQDVPATEILLAAFQGSLVSVFWTLLPFARGSVHISSANTSAPPAINPNFFMQDWDVISQVAGARFIRKFKDTEPLKSVLGGETSPGLAVVPENATDDVWAEWLSSTYTSNNHPVGTAAMMDKDLGGVLDERFRVYGTKNLRVVDASVWPFQVCGHLTSTLYAIAERAADMIKEDHSH